MDFRMHPPTVYFPLIVPEALMMVLCYAPGCG